MSLLPTLYMTKVNTIIKKHDVNAVNCDFQQKFLKKEDNVGCALGQACL